MRRKALQEWEDAIKSCVGTVAIQGCIEQIQLEQRLHDAAIARSLYSDPNWAGCYRTASESIAVCLESEECRK